MDIDCSSFLNLHVCKDDEFLGEVNGASFIPVKKCEKGQIGTILVNKKIYYFDFDFYKNKKE